MLSIFWWLYVIQSTRMKIILCVCAFCLWSVSSWRRTCLPSSWTSSVRSLDVMCVSSSSRPSIYFLKTLVMRLPYVSSITSFPLLSFSPYLFFLQLPTTCLVKTVKAVKITKGMKFCENFLSCDYVSSYLVCVVS